jgi:hypothetical protein
MTKKAGSFSLHIVLLYSQPPANQRASQHWVAQGSQTNKKNITKRERARKMKKTKPNQICAFQEQTSIFCFPFVFISFVCIIAPPKHTDIHITYRTYTVQHGDNNCFLKWLLFIRDGQTAQKA